MRLSRYVLAVVLALSACSAQDDLLVHADSYCVVDYQGVALSNGRPVEHVEVYLVEDLDNAVGTRRHRIGETDASGVIRGKVALSWGEEARIVEDKSGGMHLCPLVAQQNVTVVFEVDECRAAKKVFNLREYVPDQTGTVFLTDEVEIVGCDSPGPQGDV